MVTAVLLIGAIALMAAALSAGLISWLLQDKPKGA
jgi:hypothetical protein